MTATNADNDIWHVMLASDDVKRMNVDQLDDAFRLSLVDASTMVWKGGMATWRRLGSMAGLDDTVSDDFEELTKRAPPPPPPPRPAPLVVPIAQPRFLASTPSMHTAVTPIYPSPWPERHAPTPPRPIAPPLKPLVAQPLRPLVVPPMQLHAPQLLAPDPYMLPKRRVAISSDVDFRRPARGVRWGRWLVGLTLLTAGVLGLYRQNLLREGARHLGLETKYLAGEHRITAAVAAKSPPALTLVLTKLALLPGPNAETVTPPAAAAKIQAPSAPATTEAAPATAAKPAAPSEPEIKTVSLDSLPVMADAAPSEKAVAAPAKPAPEPAPRKVAAAEPRSTPVASKPAKVEKAEATPPAPKHKPEPVAAEAPKPTPKPQPAPPPPSGNEGFLKAAIRSAIAADAAKH